MWFETSTNKIYETHSDIRLANSTISLPLVLTDEVIIQLGLLPLVDSEKPTETEYVNQCVVDTIVANGNTAIRNWKLIPLTEEQISQKKLDKLAKAKAERSEKIASITVTTQAGNTFDGDEKSQDRMARAIAVMDDVDTIPWVMHDNTVSVVTKAELREALKLAGPQMAMIWVSVYS